MTCLGLRDASRLDVFDTRACLLVLCHHHENTHPTSLLEDEKGGAGQVIIVTPAKASLGQSVASQPPDM